MFAELDRAQAEARSKAVSISKGKLDLLHLAKAVFETLLLKLFLALRRCKTGDPDGRIVDPILEHGRQAIEREVVDCLEDQKASAGAIGYRMHALDLW